MRMKAGGEEERTEMEMEGHQYGKRKKRSNPCSGNIQ
jgi:hypothetical protein